MKRALLVVAIVVVVIVGIVGGIMVIKKMTADEKMLVRAGREMDAQHYDRAYELARSYSARHSEEAMGYHYQARALIHLGRYEEAQRVLNGESVQTSDEELKKKVKAMLLKDVTCRTLLADTHGEPASKRLSTPEIDASTAAIQEVIDQFGKALEILGSIETKDPKGMLNVRAKQGAIEASIGDAYGKLEARHKKEKDRAKVAGNDELSKASGEEKKAAAARQKEHYGRAIDILLEVVQQDNARTDSAKRLAELCSSHGTQESLEKVRSAFDAMANPPAEAAMTMIYLEFLKPDVKMTAEELAEHQKKLVARMDGIVEANSGNHSVRLLRAQVALMQQDMELSEKLCDEVLKAEPGSSPAKLLSGRLLLIRAGQAKQDSERLDLYRRAEQTLSSLRQRLDQDETHYLYYLAAMGLADTEYKWATKDLDPKADRLGMDKAATRRSQTEEMGRTALRRAADADRGNFRVLAHRDFALWLLSQKSYDEALADARACYKLDPDQPEAVELMVLVSMATGQPDLAKSVLETAEKSANRSPEMGLAIASGWQMLKNDERAKAATEAASKLNPTTTSGRLAMARILVVSKRYAEAKAVLLKAIDYEKNMPGLYVELGRVYEADDRDLEALEAYQKAVDLAKGQAYWHTVLANALARRGQFEKSMQAYDEARRLEPNNPDILFQYLKVRAQMRLPIGPEDLKKLEQTQRGARLALALLLGGQIKQSIDLCNEVLGREPVNQEALWVLAGAYLADGQQEACRTALTKLLSLAPENDLTYIELAKLLSRQGGPEVVRPAMLGVAGARPEKVETAIGLMLMADGRFEAAAEAFGRVAGDTKAKPQVRGEALLRRVNALASAGKMEQAIKEIEPLLAAADSSLGTQAALSKVAMLIAVKNDGEALSLLAGLRVKALKDKNERLLVRIIQMYSQMKAVDEALTSCERMATILPEGGGSRPDLLQAEVLVAANRLVDAEPHFRKALEIERKIDPQAIGLGIRRRLATVLDALGRPMEAKQQLEMLLDKSAGGTANLLGRLELANLYRNWDLDAKALAELQALAESSDPSVLLAIGQSFAMLGDKEQALKQFEAVPESASQYVEARQMIVLLTPDPAARREALKKLSEKRPGNEDVLRNALKILWDMGDYPEAERVYREFALVNYSKTVPPQDVAVKAVEIKTELGHQDDAAELASRMYKETKLPSWRFLTLCLTVDVQPSEAKALLPPVGEATYYDAVYGYLLHRKDGAAVAWLSRLKVVQEQPLSTVSGRPVPTRSKLLATLVAGEDPAAALAALSKESFAGKLSGEELVAYAKANAAKAGDEAIELLKAETARLMPFNALAYSLAMNVLQKRPECLAAAGPACAARPTNEVYRKVTDLMRPADGVLVRGLRGALLSMESKHEEAIKVLQGLVAEGYGEPAVLLWLARSLEAVDRKAEAAKYYREVWSKDHQDLRAANNGAYLLAMADPTNKQNLAEARTWIEEAAKEHPGMAFMLDTSGWIAYLQGRHEEALRDLQIAVRVMRGFPQVHSHLGQAALAVGNQDLARMHLEAAVKLYRQHQANKQEVTPDMADAVRQAEEALDKTDWKKTGS